MCTICMVCGRDSPFSPFPRRPRSHWPAAYGAKTSGGGLMVLFYKMIKKGLTAQIINAIITEQSRFGTTTEYVGV